MPTLPILCITGKLEYTNLSVGEIPLQEAIYPVHRESLWNLLARETIAKFLGSFLGSLLLRILSAYQVNSISDPYFPRIHLYIRLRCNSVV